jgi:nucleoside triphosphate diphosphatase
MARFRDPERGRDPNAAVIDTDQQTAAREAHKTKDRADANATSILDGIASALPALLRAVMLQRRAAAVGFDWAAVGAVHDAVRGELDEVGAALAAGEATHIAEEIGDLLFACINLARFARVDPESALRAANQKFERRFRYIEQQLQVQGPIRERRHACGDGYSVAGGQAERPKKKEGAKGALEDQKEEAQSNRLVLSQRNAQ